MNMSELKTKNMMAKNMMGILVKWEAYIQTTGERIKELADDIKDKTVNEREAMKKLRSDLKAAVWKKDSILAEMHEEAEAGSEISGKITLDDFDTEDAEINIELTKKEFKEAQAEVE